MTGIFKAEVPYHLDDFNEIGYNRIFFLFKRSNNGYFLFVCLFATHINSQLMLRRRKKKSRKLFFIVHWVE